MKKVPYLFILLSCSILAQNTSLKVSYQQALLDQRLTKTDAPRIFKGIEYLLIANDSTSQFRLINKLSENERGNLLYAAKAGVGEFDIFYTNLTSKESLVLFATMGEELLVSYPFSRYSWEITSEQKKIGKYNCRKAVVNFTEVNASGKTIYRRITAWFTPEIPLSFGPRDIYGLPGLILEAQEGKNIFIANEIAIKKEKLVIERPTSKKELTAEEFSAFIRKLRRRN